MNRVLSRAVCLLAITAIVTAGLVSPSMAAAKKLNVITATTDLASLAQEVGGDKINVESMAKGYQDPHFVEAKPSFLLKLRQADLLVVVGLQLEIGWLPPLITQSGNSRIQVGANGSAGQSPLLARSGQRTSRCQRNCRKTGRDGSGRWGLLPAALSGF